MSVDGIVSLSILSGAPASAKMDGFESTLLGVLGISLMLFSDELDSLLVGGISTIAKAVMLLEAE